jgi:serine/threonine protein kinase/tetratricopeptide (TPR) repeat protein
MVEYLGKAREGIQTPLLRNLLQIDIQRRRLNGERPQAEDYLRWFPQHESVIRQEFLESMSMHRSVQPSRAANAVTQTPIGVPQRLGDYTLLSELGRGGMGTVYEAVHVNHKNHVALKVLPDMDGRRLHLFKREFRSLANVNHPNLIGLHRLECDGEQWFFTMDLIDGTDFIRYARPDGELNEQRLRSALTQLVTGVMALHANCVVHRDLKPSNVMVDGDGRVILLDFGLVIDFGTAAITQDVGGIVGTPAYMSPEQAAGRSVNASCDWYAVGIMLFQALTGTLPFRGSVLEVIRDKQQQDPPPLPQDAGLPEDLCQLCVKLLARQAEDRPNALEITASVAAPTSSSISFSSVGPDELVGREVQLQTLGDALRAFDHNHCPVTVFVSGRSGEGKTTLCDAFLEPQTRRSRYAVMQGRCYDRESVPFKALDSTIDALCAYLNSLPASEVPAVLPRDVSILAHVFPVFRRVEAVATTPEADVHGADEQEVRTRAFTALRELFGRISDRRPVILFIDDLQWGDADSADVLLQVLKPPRAPAVFLLATFRSDEADDSPFLHKWQESRKRYGIEIDRTDVTVSPFSLDECAQLVINLLQQDNDVVRRRAVEFYEQTGGNPYLLTELVGCFDPHADSFRPMPVREVLDEKLRRLPVEARQLLELIAVSGQPIDLKEAAAVAGYEVPPTGTVSRMRSERLIRFLGSEQNRGIDTYHDRIRETVLSEMDASRVKELHRGLGEYIERAAGGLDEEQIGRLEEGVVGPTQRTLSHRLFDLSFHFDSAGLQRKALAYSLLAAEQARQQFALEVAAAQYQVARRNFGHCKNAARRRVLTGLGETSMLLARYQDADACLREAHHLADESLDRCEIELLLGEFLRLDSHYAASAEQFTTTLRELGHWIPSTLPGLLAGIVKEGFVQLGHTLARYPRRSACDADRQELLINRLLHGLTMSLWFRSTPSTVWCTLSMLNRCERQGPSTELADASSLHGAMCAFGGLYSRGIRYLDRALASIDEENLASQLLNYLYRLAGQYAAGHYELCKETATQGLIIGERRGDLWRAAIMRVHVALSNYRLGNLAEAFKQARNEFDVSIRLGDRNTSRDHLNLIAILTRGNFPYEEMAANLIPVPDNYQATNQELQAAARWHMFHGRTREGLELAQRSYDLMIKHVVINHITSTTFPLLLEAIRQHADAQKTQDPGEADRLLRRGYRKARWATVLTKNLPDYPATLRELSRYCALRGKLNKAIKIADRSLRIAEARQMRYESALSCLARTQYQHQLGVVGAVQVEEAKAAFEEFDREMNSVHE